MRIGEPVPRALQDLSVKGVIMEINNQVCYSYLCAAIKGCLVVDKGECTKGVVRMYFSFPVLCVPFQTAVGGYHVYISSLVKNNVPVLMCGLEEDVQSCIQSLRSKIYPMTLLTYPIYLFKAGGGPPYHRQTFSIVLAGTTAIGYTVCALPGFFFLLC